MTKTWDPNHAAKVYCHNRGQHKPKKRVRYGPVAKRNGFIQIARRLARNQTMNAALKLDSIRSYVIRANACAPVSRRQVCGLIELLGRANTERVLGYKVWL